MPKPAGSLGWPVRCSNGHEISLVEAGDQGWCSVHVSADDLVACCSAGCCPVDEAAVVVYSIAFGNAAADPRYADMLLDHLFCTGNVGPDWPRCDPSPLINIHAVVALKQLIERRPKLLTVAQLERVGSLQQAEFGAIGQDYGEDEIRVWDPSRIHQLAAAELTARQTATRSHEDLGAKLDAEYRAEHVPASREYKERHGT